MPDIPDATIIYYSSCQENKRFETAILDRLYWTTDGLPIIMVTQKPVRLGDNQNICVGDVGLSNINIFRQMMIGIEAAKSKYIITAEADYVHPPEFFKFRPPRADVMYGGMPLYILSAQRGKRRVFCPKEHPSEGAMIASRDLALKYLQKMLKGRPMWANSGQTDIRLPFLFRMGKMEEFKLPAALVTFRTGNQMHRATPYKRGSELRELPYWGKATDLIIKYMGQL